MKSKPEKGMANTLTMPMPGPALTGFWGTVSAMMGMSRPA